MKFIKENGPHIKTADTTSKIMTRLLIALSPIITFALFKNCLVVYFYSNASLLRALNPLLMIIISVLTTYFTEVLWFKYILKNDFKKSMFEASRSFSIIPGLLLALVLPPNVPLWIVFFGAFAASTIKMLFGGFGQNIFNPALIGYLIITASYSSLMGSSFNLYELDAVSTATPLTNLANLNYIGNYESIVGNFGTLFNFLAGSIPGALGETSKILILIAFIYLVITKTIKWIIPVTYVSTVFIITFIIGNYFDIGIWYPLFHILSGGLLFGAVFMATDPVTSPLTTTGQLIHGVCLGIFTVSLRFLTPYPEGVMTSILFMNMLVPTFDKIGLKAKYNSNILKVAISVLAVLIVVSAEIVIININGIDSKDTVKNKVVIKNIETRENKKIYTVTSVGWGKITANVLVDNGMIEVINVTDSSSETQWNEIQKDNYIDKVIKHQNDIDSLDAIAGSTYSCDALKNIVKKVKNNEK